MMLYFNFSLFQIGILKYLHVMIVFLKDLLKHVLENYIIKQLIWNDSRKFGV